MPHPDHDDAGAFGEALPYEQGHLEARFLEGAEAFAAGKIDLAEAAFREVVLGDPRLPEPRLELAVLLFRKGDLEEAEVQARLALEQVERGWQWLENFEEGQLLSHALNLLGEILVARAAADDAPVGEGEEVFDHWKETERLFRRAVDADPSNSEAKANLIGFRRRKLAAEG